MDTHTLTTAVHAIGDTATIHIPGHDPSTVFALVTDVDCLAGWNVAIVDVVERPPSLRAGAVWKVVVADGPMRWVSRSTVVAVDPTRATIHYRSGTDDGNPSFTQWWWSAVAEGDGTALTVRWSLQPRTRFRRWFLARYRRRRLRHEVPASLVRIRHELMRSRPDESADVVPCGA